MVSPVSPQRLAALLSPRSVALVGASDRSGFSRAVYRNLAGCGFGGAIHLVSRRGVRAHGRDTVTSCTAIGEPVDLAFLMVPQAAVAGALADAAAAGIRSVAVLASGFADAGEAGRRAQADLVARAEAAGVLLLGPNHLGFANLVRKVAVTAIPGLPREAGPVAVVSQSGLAAGAMADFAVMTGVGLSHVVTVGNEAMVTAAHVLDYLAGDGHTAAVAVFLETLRDPAEFAAAARRAAAAGKAVVVLKAGGSELSARTAAAHSGAPAGGGPGAGRAAGRLLRELGVIRVRSVEELILTAGAAAHLGRLARPGIGVVSVSGGACVLAAEHAAQSGAVLPALAPATCATLTEIIPGFGTVQNPLDVTGGVVRDPGILARSIEAVAADPAVGVVAVIAGLPWQPGSERWPGLPLADAIGAGASAARVPVVTVPQALQPVTVRTRRIMSRAGIGYVLPGLQHAVAALANLARWSQHTAP